MRPGPFVGPEEEKGAGLQRMSRTMSHRKCRRPQRDTEIGDGTSLPPGCLSHYL